MLGTAAAVDAKNAPTAAWKTPERFSTSGALALTRAEAVDLADVDLVKTIDEALMLTDAYARAHDIVVERQFEVIALPVIADRAACRRCASISS